jgi:glycosyltransferase involved in cell wall biosynthesis
MPPDEFIIIDDASTDGARDVMELYRNDARLVFNEKNLGVIGNFRKAVQLSSGDYIAFLGADNRMRADYVERCRSALAGHDDAALVYTDMSIFGARGGLLAEQVHAAEVGESASERWKIFLWRFPEPTPERIQWLHKTNFIHGSSMYRRIDYERAGGYCESPRPEDHDLFHRMLRKGRRAIHLPYPLIEYRQHSTSQANTVLSLEYALERARGEVRRLEQENQLLRRGWSRVLRLPFQRSSYDLNRIIRLTRRVLGKIRRYASS